MFFEQAGSSFNFLAQNLVDRSMFGGWEFPVGWFQSVNPAAIVLLAPVVALIWGWAAKRNVEPSIPRKFSLGLLFNAAAFVEIGRAHVCTPVTNAHLVCRILLTKTNN